MISYIIRRCVYVIPMLFLISVVSFIIIQLPPGDFVTTYAAELRQQGGHASKAVLEMLRERYGLGEPKIKQYFKWISGFPRGDFGMSMIFHNTPVIELIGERLLLTMIMSLTTLLFTYIVAIPIGIFSATHQYTITDYFFTFIAFIGLSIPNFMFALILMSIAVFIFDASSVGGLFSRAFADAPWSLAKIIDLIKHLWVPVLVLGTAGTAGTMRVMRGNLLDILGTQFIQTARAKGLSERKVIYKHAVRIAINPLISGLGLTLPALLSGAVITAIVLNLPTVGTIFYRALIGQDMYLAGTIMLMLSTALILGNLFADIMLAWSDPRIRFD